jgi:cytochrome c2
MNGWRVFNRKQCIECHSIWDQGGRVGPDLGRMHSGPLSQARLAGVMWNHIPKMLGRMEQAGRPPVSLTEPEMADLFALIYFIRQLDEKGDPLKGERILQQKGCAECHSIDDPVSGHAPDLAKWGSYANPVIWAQMMWEHAPVMELAMQRSGMNWPKLEGDDLVHIVAYVRSAGLSGDKTYLRPGAPLIGRRLFAEKQCDSCHPGSGPDLAEAALPTSIGALASRMWNHSPEMSRRMLEEEVARQQISPQELTDILAYVLALANTDRAGDPARGEQVFAKKRCTECHEVAELPEKASPSVQQLSVSASPVRMAAAMWNHGPTMLDKMTEAGMSWPVFEDDEIVDLLAYLKSVELSDSDAKASLKEQAE